MLVRVIEVRRGRCGLAGVLGTAVLLVCPVRLMCADRGFPCHEFKLFSQGE